MDVHSLQQYLQSRFTGRDDFMQNIIEPIFGNYPFEEGWDTEMLEDDDLLTLAKQTGVTSVLHYGFIELPRNATHIFEVTVADRIQMNRNRVGMQRLVRRLMSGQNQQSAFMIFHYADQWQLDWRFSYCHYGDKEMTTAKRYTFLLGPGQACRTAAQNFCKLFEHRGELTPEDITTAFDVEALSKEFFNKYKEHYDRFCAYVYNNKENPELFGEEFTKWEDKTIRDYVKKLLGRIVFLHFLQKKGWMGVPADKDWGDGDMQFMKHLFENATPKQKDNYLDAVLEPLFSKALDTDRTASDDLYDTGVEGFRNIKIPYLNGGLFERDYFDEPASRFDADLFDGLFEMLYEYNFTIDENDPNDAQVGVDPEMLGRIFENLLEDNKDKGAFYTPKEIVQYMCRESLIAYLQTDVTDEGAKAALRQFVTTYNASLLTEEQKTTVDEKLQNVKICDPAIGSGAFPMGMLRELFFCRSAIERLEDKQAANIKKHIIQQNIYGVDIEKGAVDIARLRFWLTLIIDEETPHALPNLDFKIMQGNSLLEQYKIDDNKTITLDDIVEENQEQIAEEDSRSKLFAGKEVVSDIKEALNDYYTKSSPEEKKKAKEEIDFCVRRYIELKIRKAYPKKNQTTERENAFRKINNTNLINPDFFLWHTWFADVFDEGGFDIVIGNPPYVSSKALHPYIKELYKPCFECAVKQYDLYSLFIEHAYNICKTNGILSYIVPDSLTGRENFTVIRKLLLNKTNIKKWVHINQVFASANVASIIFLSAKDTVSDFSFIYEKAESIDAWKSHDTIMNNLSKRDILIDSDCKIQCVNASVLTLQQKLSSIKDRFEHVMIMWRGEELGKKSECILDIQRKNSKVLLRGEDIARYAVPHCIKWIKAEDVAKSISLYKKPKVLVRQLGDRINATVDKQGCVTIQSIYNLVPENSDHDICYYLALLNSSLFCFIYNMIAGDKQLFKRIILSNIKNLPFVKATKKQQQPIITLVDRILSAKKANPQADTTAEEREIDRLVYDLYGLTEDEIAIVEGKNEK